MRSAIAALTCAALLVSCQPPLEEVWQLRDFRVLGVRVTDAEGTAQPARGQPFTLELSTVDVRPRAVANVWFVLAFPTVALTGAGGTTGGSPDGGTGGSISPSLIRALIDVCIQQHQDFGPVQCGPGTTAMFRVPAEGGAPDSQGRESLTVVGYACAGGTIGVDRSSTGGALGPLGSFTCTGTDARGWQYQGSVLVRTPGSADERAPNTSPRIAEVRFGPPGQTAPIAPDAPATVPRCLDTSSRNNTCPRVRFEVGFTPESRQMYAARDPLTAMPVTRTERLVVGYIVDRGTMAGGFRTDTAADPMSVMDDDFRAPVDPGPVRVIVYSIDGRGGFDQTERTLMVQ